MAVGTLCLGLSWNQFKSNGLIAFGNLVQQARESCSSDSHAFYDERFAEDKRVKLCEQRRSVKHVLFFLLNFIGFLLLGYSSTFGIP